MESIHKIDERLIKEFISTVATSTNVVLSFNKGLAPKWELDRALGQLLRRMLQVQLAGEGGLVPGHEPGQADYVRGFSLTHYEDVIADVRDAHAVGIEEELLDGQKLSYVDFGGKHDIVRERTEEVLAQMCNDFARYCAMMLEESDT